MTTDLQNLCDQMDCELQSIVQILKSSGGNSPSESEDSDLDHHRNRITELQEQTTTLVREAESAFGLPPGCLDSLDELPKENEEPTRTRREELSASTIPVSDFIDKMLPAALDELLPRLPKDWLTTQSFQHRGLGQDYLDNPLSLVAGSRPESEFQPTHRFAQALLAAEDFLSGKPTYNFHAGGLLLAEIARLGALVPALSSVPRSVARLEELYKKPSESYHSTLHELLVGGTCAESGLDVEFLNPTHQKTPEMRLHNLAVPAVIECKRQQFLGDYERREESLIRDIFAALQSECCRAKGCMGCLRLTSA